MPDGTRQRPLGPKVLVDELKSSTSALVDDDWGEMTPEAIRSRAIDCAPRNPILRHHLARRLYLVLFVIVSLFVLVPLWTLLYIPRRNRPCRAWTLKRCLRVRWSRRICAVVARCEIDYLGRDLAAQMDPQKLEHSHPVEIAPAPDTWLRGHAAKALDDLHESRGKWHPKLFPQRSHWGRWNPPHAEHGFAPVPGFWFTGPKDSPDAPPRPREPGQPVMLHFHGGGYVCGTAAETDLTSSIAKSLVQYTPITHVLSVDYRLAPTAPWPLPLLDAISGYHHLVKVEGFDERDLLIGGDSAGGHLALALTRYLRDNGEALGLKGPKALVLLSPWCDVGFTHQWGSDGLKHNAETDTIDDTFGPFASGLLTRALPVEAMHEDPYLAPASLLIPAHPTGPLSFERFPPMFVVYGEAERLSLEINELWRRLQLGRKLDPNPRADYLLPMPDAVHDFAIFPWFAEEAAKVYETLDDWLRSLMGTEDSDEDSPVPAGTPVLAPLSPVAPIVASPDLLPLSPVLSPLSPFSLQGADLSRRRSRRESRAALLAGKSPRLVARRDTPRLMVTDMRAEGSRLIDLPPLDIGEGLIGAAREALTPFTSQFEKGEWDWGDGGEWFELGASDAESAD